MAMASIGLDTLYGVLISRSEPGLPVSKKAGITAGKLYLGPVTFLLYLCEALQKPILAAH